MKKVICFLLLLSSTAFAKEQAFVYVSNPSAHWHDTYVVWEGKGPDCTETTAKYDTFGWKYGLYDQPVRVSIMSRTSTAPICTIDIDDRLQGPFPRVRGNCYVIHSNPGRGFDTSWITLYETAPYRCQACQ